MCVYIYNFFFLRLVFFPLFLNVNRCPLNWVLLLSCWFSGIFFLFLKLGFFGSESMKNDYLYLWKTRYFRPCMSRVLLVFCCFLWFMRLGFCGSRLVKSDDIFISSLWKQLMKFDLGLLVFGCRWWDGYRLHLSKWIFYYFVLLLLRLRAIPFQRDDEDFVIGWPGIGYQKFVCSSVFCFHGMKLEKNLIGMFGKFIFYLFIYFYVKWNICSMQEFVYILRSKVSIKQI